MGDMSEERSRKRRRVSNDDEPPEPKNSERELPHSLTRSISPPPLRRSRNTGNESPRVMKSPFQLTWVRDLPESSNQDAVSLKDILGDPMISECWEFNYLHNLDFLMDAFDPDVRDLIKVHVVHGFWKNEDRGRLSLKAQAEKYPNITLHTAYMPEMFGTHHTKMLVLLRHDDTAQIIIHTANMIPFDWTNMTQAAWTSPLLPLRSPTSLPDVTQPGPIGSGTRFKVDFLNYLKAYDNNPKRVICKPLVEMLEKHDFSAVRGALVGSVPGKHHVEKDSETAWGWAGLKDVLSTIPVQSKDGQIVIQISSIATLSEKWTDKTLFNAMSTSKNVSNSKLAFKIIFPTANEIRRSLNGYESGSAIHTKIQSTAQAKQVQYLKPMLCHWASDSDDRASSSGPISDAGRKRAAPHIKTFIRFADAKNSSIDWMLVTSANLSKQAWGEAMTAGGDIRICSYELGVMVWPELFGEKATMVPTFKTDMPSGDSGKAGELVIGARMPYDLPLVPYGKDDLPWCASSSYKELDWKGDSYRVE
ncbi:tyrosyl-DNA phosphodiesterase I [Rhexocercosporidium sp. MPI-PUGE-AT-0058]|nr:tyrosyl-DNA phosphodiesterase I [Rhexocercosporidium sp. MPI-PUGE-AT-0058]